MHLVGLLYVNISRCTVHRLSKNIFITKIYHDARSTDCQKIFLLRKYITMHGPQTVKKYFYYSNISRCTVHRLSKKTFLCMYVHLLVSLPYVSRK
jgi:hypothetical protein